VICSANVAKLNRKRRAQQERVLTQRSSGTLDV